MLCCLLSLSDVPIMVGFVSGREEILQPNDSIFYEDKDDYLTDDSWDFVEWGWLKDIDVDDIEDYLDQFKRNDTHNWAVEGF